MLAERFLQARGDTLPLTAAANNRNYSPVTACFLNIYGRALLTGGGTVGLGQWLDGMRKSDQYLKIKSEGGNETKQRCVTTAIKKINLSHQNILY